MKIMSVIHERYQVLKQLGCSSVAHTYLAKDLQSEQLRLTVVKMLRPSQSGQGFVSLVSRLFHQEADLLHKLEPYGPFPHLLDRFCSDGIAGFTQEFIAGVSLQAEFDRGVIWSETTLIGFLQEALAVLAIVHGAGIVHRDLKPVHWIQRYEDSVRAKAGALALIDFGAAQLQSLRTATVPEDNRPDDSDLLTSTRISIGTTSYMAPEQLQGYVDPSSDLYALGLIAIQGITGIEPSLLPRNAQGELSWQPLVSLSLEAMDVLTRMVRHAPQSRYRSAIEVLADLQQLRSPRWNQGLSHWLNPTRSSRGGGTHRRSNGVFPNSAPRPQNSTHMGQADQGLSPTTDTPLEADPIPSARPATFPIVRPRVLFSALGKVPDALLADLEASVSTQVWISDGWASPTQRIEAQQLNWEAALRGADVCVMCLTPESIQNPALLTQLQALTRPQPLGHEHGLQLLPVRIGLNIETPLPEAVRYTLRQVRQHVWRSPEDTPRIVAAIYAMMPSALHKTLESGRATALTSVA